jgi:hypothetical protein
MVCLCFMTLFSALLNGGGEGERYYFDPFLLSLSLLASDEGDYYNYSP